MKPTKYVVKLDMYIYASNDLDAKDQIFKLKEQIKNQHPEANPSQLELGKLVNGQYKEVK